MLANSGKGGIYTTLAELPIPTAASFQSSDVIRVTFSKKDHERDMKRTFSKTIVVTSNKFVISTLTQDSSEIQASVISPSKSRVAILRKTESNGEKKRFVEIWCDDRLEVSRNVTTSHGAFYTEDGLVSLSFSPSENAFVYTAEALDVAVSKGDSDIYDTYRYKPPFGEGYSGKKRPTLFLLKWGHSQPGKSSSLTTLTLPEDGKLDNVLFGQAVFAGDNLLFASGYEYFGDGRLLGIKGCLNRPSGVWKLGIPKIDQSEELQSQPLSNLSKLTLPHRSSRSPRVFRKESGHSVVVWISNQAGGAHASSTSIHTLDVETGEEKTILGTIWEPSPTDSFPGYYGDFSLPSQPFLRTASSLFIVFHSAWGSRTTVLLVNVADGHVKDLTPDTDGLLYSWTVLATDGNSQVVCVRSSLSRPPEVLLGKVDDNQGITWQVINKTTLTPEVENNLKTLHTSVIKIPDHYPTEVILLESNSADGKPKPCVSTPHGGPHVAHATSFAPMYTAMALKGFTISLINYTGSLGFGETYVRKLIGQAGTLDVNDCIASVHHLIKIGKSESGPDKQFVQGGSHGGFLVAHLIGQHPDVFGAAVVRNPVISCGEISTTDIPDWYFEEFGLPYEPTTVMSPDLYTKLFTASPISYVDNVRAKVLLHMGEVDLRVAPTNTLTFYHALKGRGKTVELLTFPKDSHPLEGVKTSRICWESARDWFENK